MQHADLLKGFSPSAAQAALPPSHNAALKRCLLPKQQVARNENKENHGNNPIHSEERRVQF